VSVSKVLEELAMPILAAEGSSFKDKKPISDHEVDVCQDDGDRFHDVPGKVEIDEVVNDCYLCHDEGGEPLHTFVCLLG